MYDNSVRLIGFLGQNAEKRTARNNTPYVILNLATTVRWRAKESKENVERTEWHRLVAWGTWRSSQALSSVETISPPKASCDTG